MQAAAPSAISAGLDADSLEPGEFAALMDAQRGTLNLAPLAPAASATAQAAAAALVETGKKTDQTGTTATLLDAASDTASLLFDETIDPAQAPVVTIAAGEPQAAPSEAALTQAIGGEDDSAEAAEAALAAAIEIGVAPQASEKLVLAATLPVSVRSAASVRVLDQLLDGIAPRHETQATFGGLIAENPADALAATLANGLEATSTASSSTPAAQTSAVPAAPTTQSERSSTSKPSTENRTPTLAAPATAQAEVSSELDPAAIVFGKNAASAATDGVSAVQTNTSAPADTPGTPRQSSEPAALSNGMSAARAVEVLRQRFASDGNEEPIRLSVHNGASDTQRTAQTPHAAFQGGLVAPTTAAALAAQNALAPGANAQGISASGAGPVNDAAIGPGAAMLTAANADGFLGQDGAGEFGADPQTMFFASGSGNGGVPGLDASADGAQNFNALLSGQAAANTARPTATGPAPAPAMMTGALAPEQIAVHIATAARNGIQNLSVQLRPAALGRIDVQLSVARDGTVRARVLAERADTLDLLQRHADGLETALESAGLQANAGGLSFGLKNGGDNDQHDLAGSSLPQIQGEPTSTDRINPALAATGSGLDGHALNIEV